MRGVRAFSGRGLVVAVAVLCVHADALGVVLCARPRANGTYSTSLKLREACQGSETVFDSGVMLGLQGVVVSNEPGFVVVDASERVLGTVLQEKSTASTLQVLYREGTVLLSFMVRPTGIVPDTTVSFFYESDDCSGTRRMFSTGYPNDYFYTTLHTSSGPAVEGYYAVPPFETRTLRSVARTGGCSEPQTPLPNGSCCERLGPSHEDAEGVGFVGIVDLSSYTPPFRLR
jgi:hypothetical protein